MLSPIFCSRWNGDHVWLQWTPVAASCAVEMGYAIEMRFRSGIEWEPWLPISNPRGPKADWAVIPTLREGQLVQCRVRSDDSEWEMARAVDFKDSKALFEISNISESEAMVLADTIFHGLVDDAACAYVLVNDLRIPAGQNVRVHLHAVEQSGYAQLDHPGHFKLPGQRLVVQNVEPSEDQFDELGRDWDHIVPREQQIATITFHQK